MIHQFEVEENVYNVVAALQEAGYETYIVGGAIRDLLQNRPPKDYDISTAATPEEVREVFGRRRARIIGRRFQLVHVRCGKEIFEVSTFRRAPAEKRHEPQTPGARKIAELEEAENMIFNDNDFGTSEEDAWRRDFTVNALFYDPVSDELIDFTGSGLNDIEQGLIRAIGDAKLRFEEDPVRMLRALKLVGQYGFKLERKTENALLLTLPMLTLASVSRLSLELEKILNSNYAGNILQAFADYGLLQHFLPNLTRSKEKHLLEQALQLLKKRDQRVLAGYYRNSASLAMAALALPFLDCMLDGNSRQACARQTEPGVPLSWPEENIRQSLQNLYLPLALLKRLSFSACRMLAIQPLLLSKMPPQRVIKLRGFAHAMELFKIQCEAGYLDCSETIIRKWRDAIIHIGGVNRLTESSGGDQARNEQPDAAAVNRRLRRRRHRHHRGKAGHAAATQDKSAVEHDSGPSAEYIQLGF